jgi:hypothetical protein
MFRKLVVALMAFAAAAAAGEQRMPVKPDSASPVVSLIKSLELGKPLGHGGLTVIPVYLDRIGDRTSYVTLEDALQNGWILISEVEGGRVPQVRISNLSRHAIFLMDGEILTGCRQDRLLAQDILLAPGTKNLLAPVFCVEQGRWSQTSSGFTSKQNLGTPALRAVAGAKGAAAQSEIWNRIAAGNRRLDVASPTDAYQDAYEKEGNRTAILNIEKKMKDVPFLERDTVGVVIGIGGEIVSVDIFANPDLFAKQWPKILKSSALSSLGGPKGLSLGRDEAAEFLRSFMERRYRAQSGLDLGTEYISSDPDVNIRALATESGVLHLSGFPQDKDRIKVTR